MWISRTAFASMCHTSFVACEPFSIYICVYFNLQTVLSAFSFLICFPIHQVLRTYEWVWRVKEDAMRFLSKFNWVSKIFSEELAIRSQKIRIIFLAPLHGCQKNKLRALWNELLRLHKRLTLKVVSFLLDCFIFVSFFVFVCDLFGLFFLILVF